MPAISMTMLSAAQLRAFSEQDVRRQSEFWRLLSNDTKMFYCPKCDQMVTIHKPIGGFDPHPWRADVFKFR